MENLGIFYDHLVYFTAIRNILWPFVVIWYFLPVLLFWTKKNLATLLISRFMRGRAMRLTSVRRWRLTQSQNGF
jgi:hypothetical protein